MENVTVINMMRSMRIDNKLNLESLHQKLGGKLYRGRPEMLLLRMSNGRNVQLFRRGTVQILGHVSQHVAEGMRHELLRRLQITTAGPLVISNIVISAQLKMPPCLRNMTWSNANLSYEIELFPAALIRKWHPAHIAVFHNGKVIVTGVKTVNACKEIFSLLLSYLRNLSTSCAPTLNYK